MVKHLSIFLLAVFLPVAALSQQNTLDTDTFGNGSPANGTILPSYTPATGAWNLLGSAQFNNAAIRGVPGVGVAVANNVGAAYKSGPAWTADQYSQLTIDGTTLGTIVYACVRTQSGTAGNAVCGGVDSSDFNGLYDIAVWTNGVPLRLSTCGGGATLCDCFSLSCPSNGTATTGDIVNLQIQGSTVTLQVKRGAGAFVTLMTGTTSAYASGSPGLILFNSTTARLAGSWSAGSVGNTAVAARALTSVHAGH